MKYIMYIGTVGHKCQRNAEWGRCWNTANSYCIGNCLCIPLVCASVMFKESCIFHDYFGKEAKPRREISRRFIMRSSFSYTSTLRISLFFRINCLCLIFCILWYVSFFIFISSSFMHHFSFYFSFFFDKWFNSSNGCLYCTLISDIIIIIIIIIILLTCL